MKASEVRAMPVDELNEKLVDLKEELFNLRFQLAANQLENTARIKAVKKDMLIIGEIWHYAGDFLEGDG